MEPVNRFDKNDKAVPFLVTMVLDSPIILPRVPTTLDALLLGALRLRYPHDAPDAILEKIPLARTDQVFHGSRMVSDALFAHLPIPGEPQWAFYRSIYNERNEQVFSENWMDKRIYDNTDIDIRSLKKGDSTRGTFSVSETKYIAHCRGRRWPVGFYGFGDPDRTQMLLQVLPGLGRKAHRGYGHIAACEVQSVDMDFSLVRDGRPMRPLPVALWAALGGGEWPKQRLRAVLFEGAPEDGEELCVAPKGDRIPWR